MSPLLRERVPLHFNLSAPSHLPSPVSKAVDKLTQEIYIEHPLVPGTILGLRECGAHGGTWEAPWASLPFPTRAVSLRAFLHSLQLLDVAHGGPPESPGLFVSYPKDKYA